MAVEERQLLGRGGRHRATDVVEYPQQGLGAEPERSRGARVLVRLGEGQGFEQPQVEFVSDPFDHGVGAGGGDDEVGVEGEVGAVLLDGADGEHEHRVGGHVVVKVGGA